MYSLSFILTLFLINSSFMANVDNSETNFINTAVSRYIDLKSGIIKIYNKLIIQNLNKKPANQYRYIVSRNNTKSLINIQVRMFSLSSDPNDDKEDIQDVKITKVKSTAEYDEYIISFRNAPMNFEEKRHLNLQEDYFEKNEYFPKQITLLEDQSVLFTDTLNYYSVYPTNSQTVNVILPKEDTSIIKYTSKGSNKSKDKIVYTLSSKLPPFTMEPLYIHYVNNDPFVVMNYAKKEFQVSHWGNIAIIENYQIKNIGALLSGEFGRIDYNEYGHGGRNALKSIRATLPMRSWGLWYRDEIGNVSTSNAVREWDYVTLNLKPRFPILGGWKANFDIGYNLPSKFQVKGDLDQNNFMVNLTFGMPFNNILAKNYSVKVTLPEGAHVNDVKLPIDKESKNYNISYTTEYGCLDYFGRSSVVITMNDVYDIHKVYFQIYYSYSKFNLFWKPVIVIIYFFAIFLSLIITGRANISLDKNEGEQKIKID